jgi:hypothetical protein
MPKNLILTLAVIVSISACGALAWLLAKPDLTPQLKSEVQALRLENTRLKQELEQAKRTAAAPVQTPVAVATGPGSAANEVAKDLAAGAAAAPKRAGGAAANLREMMSDPGMRAVMEQQQALQIDAGYGRLMTQLGLNDEERAHFKKLLLDREKTQMDGALKLLDPNLSAQERQKLSQDMQARKDAYDDVIKQFLNDAGDFQTFKHWEDTQPERVQFDMMGRPLFSSGSEPLSPVQEQQLIDLMAQVRKSPGAPTDISNPATTNPAQMTPEGIENYIRQLETMHQNVQVQAQGILTPGQLKILGNYLEQTRNMTATGLKMSQLMMNGGQK